MVLLTSMIVLDPWVAGLVDGVEVSDPRAGGDGVQGCGAGYDGVWGDGKSKFFKLP